MTDPQATSYIFWQVSLLSDLHIAFQKKCMKIKEKDTLSNRL